MPDIVGPDAQPPAPDYEGLSRNYLRLQSSAGANKAALDAAFAAAESAIAAKGGAAGTVAAAQIEINNIVETAAIKFKRDNATAAVSFGTNPDGSTYVIHDLGNKLRESMADAQKKRADLADSVNKNFLDNPLDWLIGQISAPFQEVGVEVAEGRTRQLAVNLKALQDLTLEQYKVNSAINEASSTSLLDAKNKLALASAAGAAAASRVEMTRLGLDKINMRINMDANQFDATLKYNNQVVTLQNELAARRAEEFRVDANLRANESHEIEMKLKQLQYDMASGKDGASKEFQERLDAVTPILGLRRITAQEFARIPDNDPTKRLIASSLYSVDVAAGRLASSPARAYDIASVSSVRLPGRQELVRTWMGDVQAKAIKGLETTWKNMAPDAKEAALNEEYKKAVKATLAAIPETNNPYSPPPLASVLSNPNYANNIFAQALAPLTVNPTYATKPEDFFVAAMDLLNKNPSPDGKIDARLAQVLATNIAFIFDGIIVDNNVSAQYGKFVLPGLSQETGFNMQVRSGGLFNKTEVKNMANAQELTAYLLRRIVTEGRSAAMLSGMAAGATPGAGVMPRAQQPLTATTRKPQ